MQENMQNVKRLRLRYFVPMLILAVMSLLSACAKNVRPPSSVCVIKIDWTDDALDNLNETNKRAALILSDFCDLPDSGQPCL